MRWFLMASPILRGGDLRIDRDGSGISDTVRFVVNPIWNAYSFFTLYANVDGYRASFRADSTQLLDRYVLAKTRQLVESVTTRMDTYDLAGACSDITGYLDALNNWYIRRSRDRFWAPGAVDTDADKRDAFDTLYTVLHTLSRLAAPLLPYLTEEIYRGLTGGASGPDRAGSSVHLADWPDADALPADPELVAAMDLVRDVASTALRLREDTGLRVRLPLASLVVAGRGSHLLEPLRHLVADEVNVKQVVLTDDLSAHATFVLRPNGKVLGPRLGGQMQSVFGAAKKGEWTQLDDERVEIAGQVLEPGEYELALQSPEGVTAAALRSNAAVVSLDTDVTPELEAEGRARDVIRAIQQARKDADLVITDRIRVVLDAGERIVDAVRAHESTVAQAVLARELTYGSVAGDSVVHEAKVDGDPLRLTIDVVPAA
jgi:isoleucyl-tRNA synthetase